jgi:hypothetical protein
MDEIERFLTLTRVVLDFWRNNKPKIKSVADLATVILALSTAIMAVGTIWLASINRESIQLTTTFYENSQRPILFWQPADNFVSFRLPQDTMRFEIDYISWFNTGEGPALKVKFGPWIDNNNNPTGDTSDIGSPVSFALWPKQNYKDALRAHIETPIEPVCWRYLHVMVWYKDRFNKVYFDQTVYSIEIVNNHIDHMYQDGFYNYNWKSKKWE